MNTKPKRIDVHHHILPPNFVSALNSLSIPWTGGPEVPSWSLQQAHDMMGAMGIDAAVASPSPGVYWGGDTAFAVKLARETNEFVADVVRDDPEHFGGFATVPLPDVDASLEELEYAYDTLGLDGVVLYTSQGDRYLGDRSYDPFFEELDRRKAIVFIHPTTIPPGADATGLTIPFGVAEFTFDTTRAVMNMLYSGTLERYPSIRYIVSHAGGTIPYLAWRIAGASYLPELRDRAPKTDGLALLQKLYYDTALSTSEFVFGALKEFVPMSQVLFGSDFPYIGPAVLQAERYGLENSKVLDDAARAAIDRGNALTLFPRFA
ncbi:MAG TPA: amidohydrolase family protein [Mycobacterium sp.]|jgi:predicted TIM-barrel fold metal-dependent hydrolase|nr:amidohydrolase family protein [Mycobacterium sp.]